MKKQEKKLTVIKKNIKLHVKNTKLVAKILKINYLARSLLMLPEANKA